jgi:tetratricopeptide (TPR) repeat protein
MDAVATAAIRAKAFGPDDPDVATSLFNLAWLYYNQGRYADAEPLYKRAPALVELGDDRGEKIAVNVDATKLHHDPTTMTVLLVCVSTSDRSARQRNHALSAARNDPSLATVRMSPWR